MQKLINAYRASRTDMNALRLAHRAKTHPMEMRDLSVSDAALIGEARDQLKPFVKKLDAVIIGEFI